MNIYNFNPIIQDEFKHYLEDVKQISSNPSVWVSDIKFLIKTFGKESKSDNTNEKLEDLSQSLLAYAKKHKKDLYEKKDQKRVGNGCTYLKEFVNFLSYKEKGSAKTINIDDYKGRVISRIESWNRMSGDKIWFPARLLAKLLKDIDQTWVDSWENDIIRRTNVVIEESRKMPLLDISCFDIDGNNQLWCTLNGTKHKVFTNDGTGNYIPFEASEISEISVDHLKSIDETLKDKNLDLTELNKISILVKMEKRLAKLNDLANKLSNDLKLKNKSRLISNDSISDNGICQSVYTKNLVILKSLDIDKLKSEVQSITKDTDYEVMKKNLNSKKGNK